MAAEINYTKYFTSCKGVFQGGGCKAIAYIGAFEEAYNRGVFFSELAGTSAGSIIAALIAAGAKPDYMHHVVSTLDFKKFIRDYSKSSMLIQSLMKFLLPKKYTSYSKYLSIKAICSNYGIFNSKSIEDFVEEHLRELTGLTRTVTFEDLIPDLHIVCADLETHTVKVWNKSNTPTSSVAKAVRSSCSIPMFFQPVDNKYVDGGIVSNLPSFIFSEEPHYNRILNFKLNSLECTQAISSLPSFVISLVDTIVEGACGIQQKLGIDSYDVSIQVNDVNSVDFHKLNSQLIESLTLNGKQAMKLFLDDEKTFIHGQSHVNKTLNDKEQMRSLVSYISLEKQKEVYVSCENTYWCWELFLSLVRWINFGSKITIVTSKTIRSEYQEQEESRRRMLRAMGCNLVELEKIPVSGYFFMPKKNVWTGLIFKEEDKSFLAQYYNNPVDSILIKECIAKIRHQLDDSAKVPKRITIQPIQASQIIEKLKTDSIYENATIKFETIDLSELYFMNPYIRALKYKQIDKLYELYTEENIPPFSAAALVFNGEKESLIGPPVVELHNEKYYVIEGNTRCVYAYRHGISKLQMVVVENVETPIPCNLNKVYSIANILISDKKLTGNNRYKDFNYAYFRHIEESLRPYDQYLL